MDTSRLNLFAKASQEINRACGNCNTHSGRQHKHHLELSKEQPNMGHGLIGKPSLHVHQGVFYLHINSGPHQQSPLRTPTPTDRSSQLTRHALSLNPTRKQQSMDPLASHGEVKRAGL